MHLILASASPRRAELLRAAGFTFETVVVDVDERVRPGEAPSAYVRRLAAEKSAAAQSYVVSAFSRTEPKKYLEHSKSVLDEKSVQDEKAVQDEKSVGSGFSRTYVGPPTGGPHEDGALEGRPHEEGESDVIILGADTTVVVDGEIFGKPSDAAESAAMLQRLSGKRHDVMTGVSLRCGAYEVGRVETTAVWFSALTKGDIAWYVASGEGRDKAGAYAIQGLASRFIPRIEGSYGSVVGLPVACVAELLTEFRQGKDGRP